MISDLSLVNESLWDSDTTSLVLISEYIFVLHKGRKNWYVSDEEASNNVETIVPVNLTISIRAS